MKPGIILSKPLLTPFRSYDEILPNLWLGNLNACLDKKFLEEKKIKAVVSLYSPKLNTNFFINKKIAIFQVQVKDNLSSNNQSAYKGWMISSSPDVTPLEHPIYDLWLIDCKVNKTS